MSRRSSALLLALLLLASCAAPPATTPGAPPTAAAPAWNAAPGALIESVTTDRAAYAPGAPVTIEVALHNRADRPFAGRIALAFEHLGHEIAPAQSQPVARLAPGATTRLTFRWTPPAADFTGYRVGVSARAGDATADSAATAVDVSSDWSHFPRYGFVSRYGRTIDAAAEIADLNAYHINGLQFYDWQWQHHRPYSPEPTWSDIANRPTSRDTVLALIEQAHRRGMVAMNYNLAFGGYDGYWKDGSGAKVEWGLFKRASGPYTPDVQDFHPLPAGWATDKLYLFDPSNRDWQQYIFGREREVFAHFPFDGWHIDTLGKRGALWTWDGRMIGMPKAYAAFVREAKAALGKRLVFNSVGGYGQDQIAEAADVDVIYSELWESDGITSYGDIAGIVGRARGRSDKAIVLPAYLNKAYAQATPPGTTRFFHEPSVRLADAAIFALGAAHLELGDGDGMLSSEYFPSQPLVMSDTLKAAVRENYDFLVAYENLLRDRTQLADTPVALDGLPTSGDGRPGAIWAFSRETPGARVVHLINLKNNRQANWRDENGTYPPPSVLTNVAVKLYLPAPPEGTALWYATPDQDHGRAHRLSYRAGTDANGPFLSFTLPRLEYWDMLWLEH